MNIFLLHPDALESAREFAAVDPVRARKQLLECCQILAASDHLRFCDTTMETAGGAAYKLTHASHPIVTHTAEIEAQWHLCYDVALGLAAVFPSHACAESLRKWRSCPPKATACRALIVVRRGHPHTYASTRREYADLLRAYHSQKLNHA